MRHPKRQSILKKKKSSTAIWRIRGRAQAQYPGAKVYKETLPVEAIHSSPGPRVMFSGEVSQQAGLMHDQSVGRDKAIHNRLRGAMGLL